MTARTTLAVLCALVLVPAVALAQPEPPAEGTGAPDTTAPGTTAPDTTAPDTTAHEEEPAAAGAPAREAAPTREAPTRRAAPTREAPTRHPAPVREAPTRAAPVQAAPTAEPPTQVEAAPAATEVAPEPSVDVGVLGDQPPGQALPEQGPDTPVEEAYHQAHGEAVETQEELEGEPVEGEAQAAEEHVAEHGHGAEVHVSDVVSSIEFWGAVVNFVLLITILVWLGRKPTRSFLASRRQGIEEGLAEAKRLREAAQERYDEYTERLEKLDREIEAIREEMVAAGEAERDRIVAEAEAKAARMRREAEFLIEQQMKQVRVDLTREAVEAAVGAAQKVLEQRTSTQDQQRLAQQYLEQLAAEKQEAAQ